MAFAHWNFESETFTRNTISQRSDYRESWNHELMERRSLPQSWGLRGKMEMKEGKLGTLGDIFLCFSSKVGIRIRLRRVEGMYREHEEQTSFSVKRKQKQFLSPPCRQRRHSGWFSLKSTSHGKKVSLRLPLLLNLIHWEMVMLFFPVCLLLHYFYYYSLVTTHVFLPSLTIPHLHVNQ